MIIDLYDGKYSVENKNNGRLEIYRYHKRWPEKERDYIGDGLVLSLVQKIESQQDYIKELEELRMILYDKIDEQNRLIGDLIWELLMRQKEIFVFLKY